MRLRLDVEAQAPIVVLPVSAFSESALVCDLGTLKAVNEFLWHDSDPCIQQPDSTRKREEEVGKEKCQYCADNR